MKVGDITPWGPAQDVSELAPGIEAVGTSSHGGIVLGPKHQDQIPPGIVPFTRNTKFWEEDFDCYVPLLIFRSEVEDHVNLLQFNWHTAEEIIKKEKPEWHDLIQAVRFIRRIFNPTKGEPSTCVE